MSAPDTFPFATGGPFNPFGPFVVLTAAVAVDGEEVTVQQQIDLAAWRHIDGDPQMRAAYERTLRTHLAAALVDRLEPTITVHEPAHWAKRCPTLLRVPTPRCATSRNQSTVGHSN